MGREALKIAVDTNVLVRVLTNDDEAQNRKANAAMDSADTVVLTPSMLCEVVWVLSRGYRTSPSEIAAVLRNVLASANAEFDRPAVEAGLAMLDAGGDFADGVIAYEGRKHGAVAFVSFDREAVRLLEAQGERTQLLA